MTLSLFADDMIIQIGNPIESTYTKTTRAKNLGRMQCPRPRHKDQLYFYAPATNNPKEN